MSPPLAPRGALSRASSMTRGKADKPHRPATASATVRPALRRTVLATVSVVALAMPTASSAQTTQFEDQGQMLGTIALAIAAYKASASQCYYDSRDGKIFSDVDALFTRRLPAVWPQIREAAPDDLPALRNTARILGAKSDCVALGNAVGLGLVSALYVGQLDASVSAEMERLSKGGGRGIGEAAPMSTTPTSPKTAAEIMQEYNKAHPDLNQPAQEEHYGTALHRIRPNLVPQAPHPGIDEPSTATSADRDSAKDAAAEANPPPVPATKSIVGRDLAAVTGGTPAKPPIPPSSPTLTSCERWAAGQDQDTIYRWGTQDTGQHSRDKALLRLTLSCLGDEPPEIVGFSSSVGRADAYCEKHETAEICKARDRVQSDGALPKLRKGTSYSQARKTLMALGYKGLKVPDADTCDAANDTRCFPEMEECSGSGEGNCLYAWEKDGTVVEVSTVGDPPEIASVGHGQKAKP